MSDNKKVVQIPFDQYEAYQNFITEQNKGKREEILDKITKLNNQKVEMDIILRNLQAQLDTLSGPFKDIKIIDVTLEKAA